MFGTNSTNTSHARTPAGSKSKGGENRSSRKTPKSGKKTPLSAAKLKNITPSRNHSFIASGGKGQCGDRYVPNRNESDLELAKYLLSQSQNSSQDLSSLSPTKQEQRSLMAEQLNGGVTGPNASVANFNIFTYSAKPAKPAPGHANHQKVLYNSEMVASSCKKSIRHIPHEPDRILDAPDIVDDFYLNLIDWGQNDLLAAALGPQLYIWDTRTGNIDNLCTLTDGDYFCAVQWGDGNYLSVSDNNGTIMLYDVQKQTRLRSLQGHEDRVTSLAWNNHRLSSGCQDGSIFNHDVRIRDHHESSYLGHSQAVCGLKWSPNGQLLASGGNDNKVNVWQAGTDAPLHVFNEHLAAVKAVSWCPWQNSILATGGGTSDRHIRLWNTQNGSMLEAVDANSQVCSILWNSEYREIISGHGYPKHQLCIWKYPSMTKVQELLGHEMRILSLCMSPCGEMVMSASADESLRLWKCFAVDPKKKQRDAKSAAKTAANRHPPNTVLPKMIR